MNNSLLIRNISNLTDARYFAVYQPKYMALSQMDDMLVWQSLFEAIEAWIEGPQWLFDLSPNAHLPQVIQLVETDDRLSGVIGSNHQLEALGQVSFFKVRGMESNHLITDSADAMILDVENYLEIESQPNHPQHYVQLKDMNDWLELQKAKEPPAGMVLSGTIEEKVGWKSYDELDELLEAIS